MDYSMLKKMGGHKTKVFGCINFNCTQMKHGISRPHIHVKLKSWGYVGSKSYQKM
jgi:hypothetical protein